MLVSMGVLEAEALADCLYPGDSRPLTAWKSGDNHLDVAWWQNRPKVEDFGTERHLAALSLYLQIGRTARMPIGQDSFPSAFDFEGGKRLLPDKGFVKMCLNAEPAILTARMERGHLVFDLTEHGRSLLERE